MADVLVVGGGPAGRGMAAACADLGLRVTLVDPAPRRRWPHTYACWRAELPATVAEGAVASAATRTTAVGTRPHPLHGHYCVLDNSALHRLLHRDGIREVAGTVVEVEHHTARRTVRLREGGELNAAVLVDASGSNRVLSGGRPDRVASEQTAVGVTVPSEHAEPLVPTGHGVFMDWRPARPDEDSWPSFLYAVPLPGGRTLLEETALARRPGLPLATLRRRLRARLWAAGVPISEAGPEERVRFPLDDPLPERRRTEPFGTVPFGAAAGLVHPATGFSVADVLRSAPLVAAALSDGLERDPVTAARGARSVLWPVSALTTRQLRLRAAEGLLAMPPRVVPEFFDVFFDMPLPRRRAFLSPSASPRECGGAMSELFRRAPWWLRRRLVVGGLVGPSSPSGGELERPVHHGSE
ncbi:lycopene beta-cyclase [Actinopolyspora xinjiangensis]|uniref:Lycopene beta-cyclase n=1 Tax=Actinopolyspora xinjiangensis TaxID=405564 RepID=A0A1H0WHP5_9ACTN|nr:lycopene cyclase family protein [Actinopolyspora xinjiangensis]SDP90167.1 lycopene beta-cyclase [Actinopolyspora xinjiangensis]